MLIRFALPMVFAAAAVTGAFFHHAPADAAPDPVHKLSEPLTHENLAIYLVRGTSAPGAAPATLEEALVKGSIIVHETGSVSELLIENTGGEPVFVQFGDLVKGGKQDRVLTSSLLIPPNSGRIAIGAYCVEQGRWAKRGKEDVSRFSSSSAQIFSREAKVAIARAPLDRDARAYIDPAQRAGGQQRTDPLINRVPHQRGEQRVGPVGGQSEVWRSVSNVQSLLGEKLASPVASEESQTSLQLTIENEHVKKAQEGFLAALEQKALDGGDVIGVVIAINGKIASGDVYPSNGLFRKMWPKLIRAAATEAVANRKDGAPSAPGAAEAEKFLAEARSGDVSERALADIAQHETRASPNVLQVEARTAKGAWFHRNFLAAQ